MKLISRFFDYLNLLIHNSYFPSSVEVGKETKAGYGGIRIVIHARAKIGNHCLLGQGITIGGNNGESGVPVIENNVYIGSGVRIIAYIVIGHDSIIGVNAVVLSSIPRFSVAAGISSRVVARIDKESVREKYIHYYGPMNFSE